MSGTDWKSYADQLQILQSRGLLIDDAARAQTDLERIGYYCLSGYWYPFRKLKAQPVGLSFREDEFVAGSKFDDVVALYVFDKNLRLMALDALERIERAIRVDVAHLLGQRDCFAQYFCLMQKLLATICPNSGWRRRFVALTSAFPEPDNNAVTVQDFGAVAGWQTWGLWA